MTTMHWVLMWVGSAVVSAIIGHDKGRGEVGLALGAVFGPLGVLAIGLMRPSVEVEAERRYAVDRQMAVLKRQDVRKSKERRQETASFDQFVQALQDQVERSHQTGFADGLANLAEDLDRLARSDPGKERVLRSWVSWLNEQAEHARLSQGPIDGQRPQS